MEWNSPQVNLKGVMKAYVDEYPSHALGLLQEDTQNGFDAYPKETLPRNMKIQFKYNADQKILYYRDFKTMGMAHCTMCNWGIDKNGNPCTNKDCDWGCYHNLAYTGKTDFSLGSRGMGKSLQILSGKKTIVNTTLPDGTYMASIWEIKDNDWKWKLSKKDAKRLSQPGTEIITYQVKKEIDEELIKYNKVIQFLQEKWFKMIDKGAQIQYILIKDKKIKRKKIPKISYPPIDKSEEGEPFSLKRKKIVIKSHGRRVGELTNLEIFITKEPFNDEDLRHGIAIVKNGKQSITRYNKFPSDIPDNIRRRIFGCVDANCENEPFLNEAENSTHTNYRYTHPTYKTVRYQLNKIIKDFIQPLIKAGGERVTAKEQKEAYEILEIINKALTEIPELQIFGLMGKGPSGTVEQKPKSYPYISSLSPCNKRYNIGDMIKIKTVLKNPQEKENVVRLEINFFDPTPVVIKDYSTGLLLLKGKPINPYTLIENWNIKVDESMIPGIHWIQAELKNKDNDPILDEKNHPEKIRASIYIEQDPPIIQRKKRKGTSTQKKLGNTRGNIGKGGLANLQWFKRKDNPDLEAIIEMARASVYLNRFGRRYRFIVEGSKKKTTPWLMIAEIVAEKIIEKKTELDIEEGEEYWAAEDLGLKIKEIQDMKMKFIRTFMEKIT